MHLSIYSKIFIRPSTYTLSSLPEDPFTSLSDTSVTTTIGNLEGQAYSAGIELADIVILLRKAIYLGAAITIIASIIAILFIKNNERMLAEQKARIVTRLTIVWLAASAVTIFNIVMGIATDTFL